MILTLSFSKSSCFQHDHILNLELWLMCGVFGLRIYNFKIIIYSSCLLIHVYIVYLCKSYYTVENKTEGMSTFFQSCKHLPIDRCMLAWERWLNLSTVSSPEATAFLLVHTRHHIMYVFGNDDSWHVSPQTAVNAPCCFEILPRSRLAITIWLLSKSLKSQSIYANQTCFIKHTDYRGLP